MNNNPVRYNDPSGHDVGCPSGILTDCFGNKQKESISSTVFESALDGDLGAIVELLIPTHGGLRIQGEGAIGLGPFGVTGTVGVNVIYNRIDQRLAANGDWSVEPGIGLGAGGSVTFGPIIGWLSTNIEDSTNGYSGILSGSAAAEEAASVAITIPFEGSSPQSLTGVHVDPYYGQVPFTLFLGGGAGAAYAGVGGGLTGPLTYNGLPIRVDLTNLISGQ
jgi:hypothetical protein